MYFGASFRLNEITRFSQNEAVSCISLKKKEKKKERSKQCHFERHHKSSFSPGRVEDKGRRRFFPCIFPLIHYLPPYLHKS